VGWSPRGENLKPIFRLPDFGRTARSASMASQPSKAATPPWTGSHEAGGGKREADGGAGLSGAADCLSARLFCLVPAHAPVSHFSRFLPVGSKRKHLSDERQFPRRASGAASADGLSGWFQRAGCRSGFRGRAFGGGPVGGLPGRLPQAGFRGGSSGRPGRLLRRASGAAPTAGCRRR
jgi:hypothetical protein